MKLIKDLTDEAAIGTPEYKSAVKSVILCQLQSLLQKLATDAGEESIVIFTNAAEGTYHHLGSYMGHEYLREDADSCAENLCLNFSYYCAGHFTSNQITGVAKPTTAQNNIDHEEKTTLRHQHTRIKSTPRKRLQNHSPDEYLTPAVKRRTLIGEQDSGLETGQVENSISNSGNDQMTSLSKGGNSYTGFQLIQGNQSSPVENEDKNQTVPWIKVEPSDDYSLTTQNYSNQNGTERCDDYDENDGNLVMDTTSEDADSGNGNLVKNRPTSLIPLANIFKKYSNKKEHKISPPKKSESGTASSILRILYESQPIYKVSDIGGSGPTNVDSGSPNKVAVTLPSNLNESLPNDQYSSGATENLVLSGYYDSDSYPTYRHRQKHILNKLSKKLSENKAAQEAAAKKEEAEKDKSPVQSTIAGADTPQIFESGGRLIYTCDVCNRELSHLTSYRRHLKLHTSDRPHTCPVCKKGFIRKYHCIDHLKKHHLGVEFEPDTLTLKNPADAMVGAQPDNCTYSPSQADYNYTLEQPMSGMSEDDTVTKESIDQTASTMLSVLAKSAAGNSSEMLNFVQSHESNHSPRKSDIKSENMMLTQSNVSKSLIFNQSQNQDEVNAEVTKFPQIQSDEEYSNSSVAESYQNEPLHEAVNQNEMSPNIEDIVAHLKSSKDLKKQKRKSAESQLAPHLLKYMNNSNFTCMLCDRTFATKSSLCRHMFVHENADITSCDLCDKSFLEQEAFNNHIVNDHETEVVVLEEVSV